MSRPHTERPLSDHALSQTLRRIGRGPAAVGILLLLSFLGGQLLAAGTGRQDDGKYEGDPQEQSSNSSQSRQDGPESSQGGVSWKELLEKGMDLYQKFNFRGFYPRLDWIAKKSGPALGIRYWNPGAIGRLDAMGSAFYSWRHYQLYDFQVGRIPHAENRIPPETLETEDIDKVGDVDRTGFDRFQLYGAARYRDRTDDSFFGLGPDSETSGRLRYRIKDVLGEVVTGYRPIPAVGFTVRAGYLQHSLACSRTGPRLCAESPNQVPAGVLAPPAYFRVRATALIDFRDDVGRPHKGFMWTFGWTKWDNVNAGNRFNFNQFSSDVRGYVPVHGNRHVIAVRGVFIDEDPAPNNRIPFFLEPSLGGSDSLRGYESFRFQGDKSMLVQAEYRWEVTDRFGFALFGDTGTVAMQGSRLSLDELKSDWGIGVRILGFRRVLLRLDEAFSNEGAQTQFRLSAAF